MSKWCTHQKYTFSFCPFLEALISQFIVFSKKKKTPFDVNILKSWIESRSIHSLGNILSAYRECVVWTSSATQLTHWCGQKTGENSWEIRSDFSLPSSYTLFLKANLLLFYILVMISRYHNGLLKINVKKSSEKYHTRADQILVHYLYYTYISIFLIPLCQIFSHSRL